MAKLRLGDALGTEVIDEAGLAELTAHYLAMVHGAIEELKNPKEYVSNQFESVLRPTEPPPVRHP